MESLLPETSINIAGVSWKNPVTTASGTFGSGQEYSNFFDLSMLGAVTVKGVSITPWKGNPPPRITETHGGVLNCIGLQNPGVEHFLQNDLPFLKKYDTKIVVNICGHTLEEYIAVAERLASENVDMLELNISCPNVSAGGAAVGADAGMTFEYVSRVKKVSAQPLIVKLSPNVTSIADIAKAAEAGGADALSMINTLIGMKIDINKRKPILSNKIGGLSGPAIHPVAVRMVYQSFKAVKIPIIGMGGIQTANDAIEMLLAGATAVAIGSASFSNPLAIKEIIEGIEQYALKNGVKNIAELTGAAVE